MLHVPALSSDTAVEQLTLTQYRSGADISKIKSVRDEDSLSGFEPSSHLAKFVVG